MTKSPIRRAGFVYPEGLVRDERKRSSALTRLIALTVLIASVAVIATTLLFGIANAIACSGGADTGSTRTCAPRQF